MYNEIISIDDSFIKENLIDKNQYEESVSYPLNELSPRKNDPFERHYRSGLYGAKPFIEDSI